tara:strand:+ start:1274 stop:1609 length:336 start_codon:yes stop_codon:yes gene_type:complete
MALHNFDYTYEFLGCETTYKSASDKTPIVAQVTINITAVDKADDSKTMTLQSTRAIDHCHLQSQDLPEDFIQVADITEDDFIGWHNAGVATADLDGYFTWQIYGYAEMDGT